jgi:hypothetical protein
VWSKKFGKFKEDGKNSVKGAQIELVFLVDM